jgi:hypothetical protein
MHSDVANANSSHRWKLILFNEGHEFGPFQLQQPILLMGRPTLHTFSVLMVLEIVFKYLISTETVMSLSVASLKYLTGILYYES